MILKKSTAIVCIVTIIMSMTFSLPYFAAYGTTSAQDDVYDYDRFVLSSLNVLPTKTDENANVTRGDAVIFIAKAIYGNTVFSYTPNVFADVNEADECAGAVSVLKAAGLINGSDGSSFLPNNEIKFAEFFKIAVMGLGYGAAVDPNEKYPDNYFKLAVNGDLMKNVTITSLDDSIKYPDFIKLLYNFLNSYPLKTDGTYLPSYYVNTDKTLLDSALDHADIEIKEGIVTGNSVTLDTLKADPRIEIDGVSYKTQTKEYDKYTGYDVYAAIGTEDDTIKGLYASEKKNNVLNIREDDFISADTDKLEYAQNTVTKTINFNATPVYIKNDLILASFTDADLRPVNGDVTLIDNNDDGKYEYVFITEKEYFEVDKVSTENKAIFLKDRKYKGNSVIYLDTESSEYRHSITDSKGEAITLAKVSAGDYVAVTGTNDLKNIFVTLLDDNTMTAKIDSYDAGADYQLKIGNGMYKIAKDEDGKDIISSSDISLDKKYKIVSDGSYVAGIKEETSDGEYAILINKYTEEDDKTIFKIVSEDKKMYSLTLAEKVKYNGKTTKKKNVEVEVNTPFIYKTDDAGLLVSVDVPKEYGKKEKRKYNEETGFFTSNMYSYPVFTSDETKIFVVPDSGEADDYMSLLKLGDKKTYTMRAFDYDEDTKCVKAIVVYADVTYDTTGYIKSDTMPVMLKKAALVIDEDDETSYRLTWLEGKEEKSAYVKSTDTMAKIAGSMHTGDVFRYSLNSLGRVDNIEMLFESDSETNYYSLGAGSNTEKIFGKATDAEHMTLPGGSVGRFADVITLDTGDGTNKNVLIYSEDDIYYYLFDKESKTVTASGEQDIMTEKVLDLNNSDVFIYKVDDETKAVAIVK